MKEFSHPGTDEKTVVDFNQSIQNTITICGNEWKYFAEMVTDLDPNLPQVSCLPGEINQAILNMIINAAHAIGDVTARIKTAKVQSKRGRSGEGLTSCMARFNVGDSFFSPRKW